MHGNSFNNYRNCAIPAILETFSETTNDFGLVNLEIGTGIPVGTFAGIVGQWH